MREPTILVLNGSNLNLLGEREIGIYGEISWADIRVKMEEQAHGENVGIIFFQSNHEGELIDFVQERRGSVDIAIINPGGFTHYSVSLRDALIASRMPFIEVHLSNIAAREPFRRQSLFSDIAIGIISGFQGESYLMALDIALERVKRGNR